MLERLPSRCGIFTRILGLADIRKKAEQLHRTSSILTIKFLSHIWKHQRKSGGKEYLKYPDAESTTLHERLQDLDHSTEFANIDRMVRNFVNECKHLEQQL